MEERWFPAGKTKSLNITFSESSVDITKVTSIIDKVEYENGVDYYTFNIWINDKLIFVSKRGEVQRTSPLCLDVFSFDYAAIDFF